MGIPQPPLQQLWRPLYGHQRVGHVEAEPSTYNLQSPYPEEFNRQATSIVADYNFAPTQVSKENLQKKDGPIFSLQEIPLLMP